MARRSTVLDYESDAMLERPFLPRDLFKLIVKLESRKTLEQVNPEALEQKFLVPSGYASDTFTSGNALCKTSEDATTKDEARVRNNALPMFLHSGGDLDLPGPGTYDLRDEWVTNSAIHQHAAFASLTERDSYQLKQLAQNGDHEDDAPSRASGPDIHSPTHRQVRPRRKPFITGVDRGLLTPLSPSRRPGSTFSPDPSQASRLGKSSSMSRLESMRSTTPRRSRATFDRSLRSASNSFLSLGEASLHEHLGPGAYQIDQAETRIRGCTAPCSAAFGRSKMDRDVLWAPVWAPLANSLNDNWNTSDEYLLQRKKLLRAIRKREKRRASEQAKTKAAEPRNDLVKPVDDNDPLNTQEITRDTSNQEASKPHPNTKLSPTKLQQHQPHELDPFEWVRRQYRGQSRANYLAGKYGLNQFVRELTPEELEAERQVPFHIPAINGSISGPSGSSNSTMNSGSNHSNSSTARTSDSSRQDQTQDLQPLDVAGQSPGLGEFGGSSGFVSGSDAAFVLNCRFPGGMMCSFPVRRFRTISWVKSCLRRRFATLQNKKFDLFWQGTKLQDRSMIGDCGVHNQSIKSANVLQVIMST